MPPALATLLSALYIIMLVMAVLIAAALTIAGVRYRALPGGRAFTGLALVSGVQAALYLVLVLHPHPDLAYATAVIRIPAISLMVLFSLLFISAFVGGWVRLSPLAITVLAVPIVIIPVLAILYPPALYTAWQMSSFGLVSIDVITYGPIFYLYLLYNLVILVGIVGQIVVMLRRASPERTAQGRWLLVATVCGVGMGGLNIAVRTTLPLNPTPLGLTLVLLVYGWLFIRFRFIEVVPFSFDGVFRSMADGVIFANRHGIITQVNRSALTLLGALKEEALIGQPLGSLLPPLIMEDAARHAVLQPPPGIRPALEASFEMSLPQLKGPPRIADVRISIALDDRQHPAGQVIVLRDITEKKHLQSALIEQEKLRVSLAKEQELSELKTHMMIRIAHEFRTPLATIQLFGEMLERYFERMTPAQRAERIRVLRSQVYAITDMLDDIGNVLRGEANALVIDPAPFDLVALCHERIDQLATLFPLRPPPALATVLPTLLVLADYERISLALRNVLTNAARFSPLDTPIMVTLHLETQHDDADAHAVITVTDRGISIPPDELPRIYDPFYRGSNIGEIGGLGLGLNLARAALTAHGGSIQVENEQHDGQHDGTRVTLRLPIGQPPATPPPRIFPFGV